MVSKWTTEELEYLIKNYSNKSNLEISKEMQKSIRSIEVKAHRLNLKKSKEHKSKMISKRNKMVNRNLEYDLLKEISSKYKTRAEFQKMDSSAYKSARIMGVLDEITHHMIKQSFSIPQLMINQIITKLIKCEILYNTRSIIKPYELDIYLPEFRLAFEYNGKGWHKNDKVNKFDLCLEKKITLITIIENNRNYEEDVKTQIIKNLEIINLNCKKLITKEDILKTEIKFDEFKIIDEESIKKICNTYSRFSEFRKENINLYGKLIKMGVLNKYTTHMKKQGGITEENCINEISKYEYLHDLLKNSYRYYLWIKRNKKEYLLINLKLKQNKKLKIN